MITDGPKFQIFRFLGAPVSVTLMFFLLLPMMGFDIARFVIIAASVLIHEMAHAWVAHIKGYSVYGITLDLFAGAASIDANMHQRDSIFVSLAGPASNLLLIVAALALQTAFPGLPFLGDILMINAFLFALNILPIYPMDGGMALKDYMMISMRDRWKAARIAAIVSLSFSLLLIGVSVVLGMYILAIFGAYFAYLAYKELNI